MNLRGQAVRQAVGLAARALGASAEAMLEDAGGVLGGHRSRKAALDLAWGQPQARAQARPWVRAEVERWHKWLERPPRLVAEGPPLQAVMATIAQRGTQDPAPDGGPGGKRLKQQGAPERRRASAEAAMRHGRQSSATTFNGFQDHCVLALERHGTREVVVRPATEPAPAAVAWLGEPLEQPPGLLQRESDWGDRASPRRAPGAAQGVSIMARPWPPGGPLCSKDHCTLDCAHGTVPWPGGQSVPMVPGQAAQCPARAWAGCPPRAQCPTAQSGHGRSRPIRADAPCQPKRRAKSNTKRGRASLRTRTAVAQALSPPIAPQGRRARSQGLRTNQFAGRRHAAVRHLQVATHSGEALQLAS